LKIAAQRVEARRRPERPQNFCRNTVPTQEDQHAAAAMWSPQQNSGRNTRVRAPSTIRHRIQVSDDARYLTAGQIRQRFGNVSHMWIVRRIADAGFPKPIKLSNSKSAPRFSKLAAVEQRERDRARVPWA
jgi:hypothetical protein